MLSRQNHTELEDDPEIWRNALERRGLKVSRSQIEYLKVGGGGWISDGIQNFKNRFSFVSNSITTGSLILESPFAAVV